MRPRLIQMLAARSDFLTRIRAIEKTIDIREQLIEFGQVRQAAPNPIALNLRRSVRNVGVAGMQPISDGAVLLLAAAFEQFVSDVIVEFANNLPNLVPVYQRLPNPVRSANERYTGEALSSSRSRFGAYNLRLFVDNLRDCQAGVTPYVLNGEAMALNSRNLTSGVFQDLMSRIGISDIWVDISATQSLKRWSGRGGAKVAQSRGKNKLNELIEQRNQIAHRVARTAPGPEVIRDHIRFQRVLSGSLEKAIDDFGASL